MTGSTTIPRALRPWAYWKEAADDTVRLTAAIRIGCAPNRGQRAFEIHIAIGERAAEMSGELNEAMREREGAREDAEQQARRDW